MESVTVVGAISSASGSRYWAARPSRIMPNASLRNCEMRETVTPISVASSSEVRPSKKYPRMMRR